MNISCQNLQKLNILRLNNTLKSALDQNSIIKMKRNIKTLEASIWKNITEVWIFFEYQQFRLKQTQELISAKTTFLIMLNLKKNGILINPITYQLMEASSGIPRIFYLLHMLWRKIIVMKDFLIVKVWERILRLVGRILMKNAQYKSFSENDVRFLICLLFLKIYWRNSTRRSNDKNRRKQVQQHWKIQNSGNFDCKICRVLKKFSIILSQKSKMKKTFHHRRILHTEN